MTRSDLLRQLARLVDEGVPVASAQIVEATGSIPNEVGATMLVGTGGALVAGTVGGGQIEARVLEAAGAALAEGRSRLIGAKLTETEAGGVGMMCGGSVKVFVEVHLPEPKLVLLGAGHINLNLARLARGLGYRVIVVDDRAAWANADNYPGVEVVVAKPEDAVGTLELDAGSFVVVGTPGHDHVALAAAANTPARYIGVVASKRKAIEVVRKVTAELDVSGLLPRLYAPIGLELGGRSPEAVALSILAEVQAVRHGTSGAPMRLTADKLQCYLDEPAPRS
ncbi:MAG: hypothetical protein CSA66_06570 [Proteobacteria bacterium]|nr:MAG: hypothetical protein CSA66_06570 [Pseudomonadota bacterium]